MVREPDVKQEVVRKLALGQADFDLAGIRDEAALVKMAWAEQRTFRTLWSELKASRKTADESAKGPVLK